MAVNMNQAKLTTIKAFGLLLIAIGLGFIAYGLDYSARNIIGATETAWLPLYQGIIILLVLFVAVMSIAALMMGLGGLLAISDHYKNRR